MVQRRAQSNTQYRELGPGAGLQPSPNCVKRAVFAKFEHKCYGLNPYQQPYTPIQ